MHDIRNIKGITMCERIVLVMGLRDNCIEDIDGPFPQTLLSVFGDVVYGKWEWEKATREKCNPICDIGGPAYDGRI